MKQLTEQERRQLGEALFKGFPSITDLDRLLHLVPSEPGRERQFDAYAARSEPLLKNAEDIVKAAIREDWIVPLWQAALLANKDNANLIAAWAFLSKAPDVVAGDAAARPDRPSLVCGRAAQWGEVVQCAPALTHQLILVSGAAGQAPLHFRDRIHVHLTPPPDRSMVAVHWPKRPACDGAFYEALGLALGVPAPELQVAATRKDRVRQAVAERLANQNLILLHPVITLKFTDDKLVQYYKEWLPELLQSIPNAGKVKCVQPIEWPTESNWKPLGLDNPLEDRNSHESALELIKTLKSRKSDVLPAVEIDELMDLTGKDLQNFVENSGLKEPQQQTLLKVIQGVPPVPMKIFDTIDANWSEVEAGP